MPDTSFFVEKVDENYMDQKSLRKHLKTMKDKVALRTENCHYKHNPEVRIKGGASRSVLGAALEKKTKWKTIALF